MRMFTSPINRASPRAFRELAGRKNPSSYDRIVDVMEELVRFTVLLRPHTTQLVDRYSEREKAGSPVDPSTDLSTIATIRG
jgi:arsenic resistance protein ArsH